ncbi:stage II sporulation protein M [Micromonospora sp. b486]|nr:stage II sporulation protein M [Micromonospora sp. b486]MDM4784555.1 stage II sporulation protein M [Micromonospora sp. b486]
MITPHGLLELTGIFVAAGVGLRTAWAWIAPPAHLGRARLSPRRDGSPSWSRPAWSASSRSPR